MSPALEMTGYVSTSHLADGKLVQLVGAFGVDDLDSLRAAFLTPLPERCRDVVVDTGAVTDIGDDAVAVLLAACTWAQQHGARFLLSRSSEAFDDVLEELGLYDEMPRLSGLATAAADASAGQIPYPRASHD